ncbi:MAG: phosphoglucosamine mutase [Methanoregulaceae archaeon]|nr:phosphoglucosamine mutase [Methanoregulaceae archaeon]
MIDKKKKRLFGTNGVRGVVGEDMTPALVLRIGLALGSMSEGTIALGRDTRTSGEALLAALASGVMGAGCNVVDVGILPTPALQYLVQEHFSGGAMITASHNPPEYNGVKTIDADGTEMADERILPLEEMVFSGSFREVPWDRVGSRTLAPHLLQEYIDAVVRQFPPGTGQGMTVVVDPGSGPAALSTPQILGKMGCRVYTINGQLDGTFPGRMPEPSPEGLAPLADLVLDTGSAFGVAHDGDADRAVFIDNTGQYLEENAEFALVVDHICGREKGVLVTPVSTSRQVEEVAGRNGCSVDYTPVGSIYVARRMRELISNGMKVVFGGEGNGGLIYPRHQFCRDGGMTAAMMVHLLTASGKTLNSLAAALPQYFMIKDKLRVQDPQAVVTRVSEAFSSDTLDFTDGVRILRKDCWALVRASGTEPLLRIIVESRSRNETDSLYREITEITARPA